MAVDLINLDFQICKHCAKSSYYTSDRYVFHIAMLHETTMKYIAGLSDSFVENEYAVGVESLDLLDIIVEKFAKIVVIKSGGKNYYYATSPLFEVFSSKLAYMEITEDEALTITLLRVFKESHDINGVPYVLVNQHSSCYDIADKTVIFKGRKYFFDDRHPEDAMIAPAPTKTQFYCLNVVEHETNFRHFVGCDGYEYLDKLPKFISHLSYNAFGINPRVTFTLTPIAQ